MTTPNPHRSSAVVPDNLLVKVCGMRERGNIAELAALQPDLIGFIFYPKSARFAGQVAEADFLQQLPASIQKVGVFVNETVDTILQTARQYHLQAIQLHGEESPEQCLALRQQGYMVLKAFSVDDTFDFSLLQAYEGTCDYYLFDTKGQQYGGNGTTFNWQILDKYQLATPFFLSGGLDLEHAAAIKAGRWPQLRGIDINSRFEREPGVKDIPKVSQMLASFREGS